MNQPFPVRSLSPYQWKLHLSILDAEDDPKKREAPWYCTWDLVFRDQIFANFCKPPYFTLTYPQFPVSRDIDTYHPADDIIDSDDDDGDGSDLSPSPPNYSPFSRHGAPSPEIFRGSPNQLLHTPPGSKRDKLSPPGHKSTRIPDFAQLLYEVRMEEDMVPRPIQYRKHRLLALAEIKKCTRRPRESDFADILRQADQQARRAFTMFPSMPKLGVIIAIGAYWTYYEYDKNTIRPSPSVSERQDATYTDRSSSITPSAIHYAPLIELFRPEIFARLESPSSDKGLNMVRSRVKYLSGIGREA